MPARDVFHDHVRHALERDGWTYLAVPDAAWQIVFADALGEILIDDHVLRVLIFDPRKEEVVRWIP